MFETIIPLRWTTKLLAGLLAITLCSTSLNAQNTPQPGGKLARPVSQPLVRQQVSPELQAVLETWYKNSSQIKRLEGQHVNEDINDTFLVIKKSTGKFWFEAPDKGRIDLEPAKIAKEQEKRGKKLYKIQPGSRKRWVCDGKQIMRIDDEEKTWEKIPIPEEFQGADIMNGPLPFLFGLPPEEAKKRFALKLLRKDDKQVFISAKPITRRDAGNYDEAQIILNAKNYLPIAIKLIHPGRASSETFTFQKPRVNRKEFELLSFIGFGKKPFAPKLKDYKLVMNDVGQQPTQTAGIPQQPNPEPKSKILTDPALQVNGLHWKAAQTKVKSSPLMKQGYKASFAKGKPAPNPKMVFHVYSIQVDQQQKKIIMTTYLKPEQPKQ